MTLVKGKGQINAYVLLRTKIQHNQKKHTKKTGTYWGLG